MFRMDRRLRLKSEIFFSKETTFRRRLLLRIIKRNFPTSDGTIAPKDDSVIFRPVDKNRPILT